MIPRARRACVCAANKDVCRSAARPAGKRRLLQVADHQARDFVDEDTQPNADGIVPVLMQEAGFTGVAETLVVPTLTGSISLYRGTRTP